jgi:hypothetical protein
MTLNSQKAETEADSDLEFDKSKHTYQAYSSGLDRFLGIRGAGSNFITSSQNVPAVTKVEFVNTEGFEDFIFQGLNIFKQ